MLDELDELLETQGPESPAESSEDPIGALTASIRGGRVPDFATATPEQRTDMVRELESLRLIRAAVFDRIHAIEGSITRAADSLSARELRTADGSVRIKPLDPGYQTEDAQLHAALLECVGLGDLTKAELDDAMPIVVTYKPDHRKLNGLLRRGDRVREAIEAHRRKPEPDLLRGKVEVHREGGLS
jgi:hypothetical protein